MEIPPLHERSAADTTALRLCVSAKPAPLAESCGGERSLTPCDVVQDLSNSRLLSNSRAAHRYHYTRRSGADHVAYISGVARRCRAREVSGAREDPARARAAAACAAVGAAGCRRCCRRAARSTYPRRLPRRRKPQHRRSATAACLSGRPWKPPRGPRWPQRPQYSTRADGRRSPSRLRQLPWRSRNALRGPASRREAASRAPAMHSMHRRREIAAVVRSGRLRAGGSRPGGGPRPCWGWLSRQRHSNLYTCRCSVVVACDVRTYALYHV